MSIYGFLPPLGRSQIDTAGPSTDRAGEFKIGDAMHVPWEVTGNPRQVSLNIVHSDDSSSTGYRISDSLPAKVNFTWTVNANALYSNNSDGRDFIFILQVPGRSSFYTSYTFTIDGAIPIIPPTTAGQPSSTATAPPGVLESLTPPSPGPTSAEKGLIATAIVLGAAVFIGGVMAFIYRRSLARRLHSGKGKKRSLVLVIETNTRVTAKTRIG